MHFLARLFLFVTILFILSACSKLTQENFDQVKNEMSMREVITILGQPTKTEAISIAGISGTSATWKNDEVEIDIQFLNDKVIVKSFSKIDGKNLEAPKVR